MAGVDLVPMGLCGGVLGLILGQLFQMGVHGFLFLGKSVLGHFDSVGQGLLLVAGGSRLLLEGVEFVLVVGHLGAVLLQRMLGHDEVLVCLIVGGTLIDNRFVCLVKPHQKDHGKDEEHQ